MSRHAIRIQLNEMPSVGTHDRETNTRIRRGTLAALWMVYRYVARAQSRHIALLVGTDTAGALA